MSDGTVPLAEGRRLRKKAAAQAAAGEAPPSGDRDAGPCPVACLGHRDGVYYFVTPPGELRFLGAGEMNDLRLLGLFGGATDWLAAACPAFDRDGIPRAGAWNPKGAARLLMKACTGAGIFDPLTPVRGPGVWRAADGGLIVHAGDALLVTGADRWEPPGGFRDGAIYAAAPRCARPADRPCSTAEGRRLVAALGRWRFVQETGPELVTGFLGAAMLGGAPAWRVHLLTIGARGTGKSWLSDLVTAVLGGGATSANNVTEAGLRQALTGEARAMVLDESEAEEHMAQRIHQVIHLLRLMASGAGAQVRRGSASGRPQAFSVTGCAYLSAILPPVLKPQDRSRITVVELAPLAMGADGGAARQAALDALRWAGEASAGLRARAIHGWGRFQDTFEAYRGAFMGVGCDGRDADRIATLLAGRDLLTCDDVPEPENLSVEVERFQGLIAEAAEQDEEGEGQLCLTQLYTSQVDLWRSGERETVAEVLMLAMNLNEGHSRKAIQKIGLRLENWEDPDRRCLLVANQHVGLARLFEGTRWAGGGWKTALRYLHGVEAGASVWRFAGVRQRATSVPDYWLPRHED